MIDMMIEDQEYEESSKRKEQLANFASMAMQGLLANSNASLLGTTEELAKLAVSQAKALINELNKES